MMTQWFLSMASISSSLYSSHIRLKDMMTAPRDGKAARLTPAGLSAVSCRARRTVAVKVEGKKKPVFGWVLGEKTPSFAKPAQPPQPSA